MLTVLARNWWMVALRGVAAILFGIVAIVWPDITLGVLVAFFGAYAIVDGAFSLGAAISASSGDRWWYVFRGIFGIGAGIVAWLWPDLTALTLLYIIASWAVIAGMLEIVAGITLREELTSEWMLFLDGAVSILFGIVLFAFPGEGAIALVVTIGVFSIVLGVAHVAGAISLRRLNERLGRGGGMRPVHGT